MVLAWTLNSDLRDSNVRKPQKTLKAMFLRTCRPKQDGSIVEGQPPASLSEKDEQMRRWVGGWGVLK